MLESSLNEFKHNIDYDNNNEHRVTSIETTGQNQSKW